MNLSVNALFGCHGYLMWWRGMLLKENKREIYKNLFSCMVWNNFMLITFEFVCQRYFVKCRRSTQPTSQSFQNFLSFKKLLNFAFAQQVLDKKYNFCMVLKKFCLIHSLKKFILTYFWGCFNSFLNIQDWWQLTGDCQRLSKIFKESKA